MPARRDYGDAWRDICVTMAQIPVAGLLATDYFYKESFRRYSQYLTQVTTRLVFARPVAAPGGGGEEVLADVVSEDLIDLTLALVRDLVSLPGESAQHFNRRLADAVREVLERIQPDAKIDTRTYVINELEKVNAELYRLRGVAGAESGARRIAGHAATANHLPRSDEALFAPVLAAFRTAIGTANSHSKRVRALAGAGEHTSTPHERMLDVVQAIVAEALKAFAPTPSAPPAPPGDRARRIGEKANRLLLAFRDARNEIEQAKDDLTDEIETVKKARKPHDAARKRG